MDNDSRLCAVAQERVRAFAEVETKFVPVRAHDAQDDMGGTQLAQAVPDADLDILLGAADAAGPPPEGPDVAQVMEEAGEFEVGYRADKVEELATRALRAPALEGKGEEVEKLTVQYLRETLVGDSWKKYFPTPGKDPLLESWPDDFASLVNTLSKKAIATILEKRRAK